MAFQKTLYAPFTHLYERSEHKWINLLLLKVRFVLKFSRVIASEASKISSIGSIVVGWHWQVLKYFILVMCRWDTIKQDPDWHNSTIHRGWNSYKFQFPLKFTKRPKWKLVFSSLAWYLGGKLQFLYSFSKTPLRTLLHWNTTTLEIYYLALRPSSLRSPKWTHSVPSESVFSYASWPCFC